MPDEDQEGDRIALKTQRDLDEAFLEYEDNKKSSIKMLLTVVDKPKKAIDMTLSEPVRRLSQSRL